MTRSVLLLRAVNLGGRNRVPMAELRAALTPLLGEVSTYIASGNIVCKTPDDVDEARAKVRELIAAEFDVDTPVIARTHGQLVAAVEENPFPDAAQEKLLHVMFLEEPASEGAVEALRPRLQPDERIALVGDDLWIDYGARGVHGTKLTTAVLGKALGVAGTARNLSTVRKLAELTA